MRLRQAVPGQRWVSDTEPELGLGIILKTEFTRVEVFFPAASEHRQYALNSAPLRRVRFDEGDRIQSHDGEDLFVHSVEEREGLLVYKTRDREVAEAELSDAISFSKPEERLLGGQVDDLRSFDLRVESLFHQNRIRKSAVRGFVGGRVDLLPHQMFIAGEVASRLVPRVLLADEVGLGKTIEAALILHRLHLTGRAERVLILVPESLVHQWFVELLRRFNLSFSIFDEERCASIQLNDPEANPFLDSQLVLCSVDLLLANPERARQVREGKWDLLIVDEAHHLVWSPEESSPQYALVEALSKETAGLLLLTATPQQLGPEGHFARLRLLDPDRYTDLKRYREEADHYEEVAAAVDRLLVGEPMNAEDEDLFGGKSPRIRRHCKALAAGDQSARESLVAELLDEFGTGRVMFRNTRAALSGFPERKAFLVPLEAPSDADPVALKVKWLAGLLRELGEEKVLTICRTRRLAEEISERLQREVKVKCALFHEELTLLLRDRNAAFFAEDEGARVLICSEIGSEGRNFQFAHHLVLFDLPGDPELLEQRIGRLDRIGQSDEIHIHVPYVAGGESEVFARWYHEGLNAFEKSLHGAMEIVREVGEDLSEVLEKFDAAKLEKLIRRSEVCRAAVKRKLERGHDRLLELNSSKPDRAQAMIRKIRALDAEEDLEDYLLRVLDQLGLHIEDIGSRSYLFQPGNLITDAIPALPDEGLSVTFDRARALSREDTSFMSWDHPIVRGALDLFLGSQSGNASFGVWKTPGEQEAVLLEIYGIAECVAPASLHADRFLPATPVRAVVDHELEDQSDNEELVEAQLLQGDLAALLKRKGVKQKLLPAMLEKARSLASLKMSEIVAAAAATMESRLQDEIDRLEDLREINDHVRPEEIEAAKNQKAELREAITSARLRLDSVRLIWRVP